MFINIIIVDSLWDIILKAAHIISILKHIQ